MSRCCVHATDCTQKQGCRSILARRWYSRRLVWHGSRDGAVVANSVRMVAGFPDNSHTAQSFVLRRPAVCSVYDAPRLRFWRSVTAPMCTELH
jgi:hypothetical protein